MTTTTFCVAAARSKSYTSLGKCAAVLLFRILCRHRFFGTIGLLETVGTCQTTSPGGHRKDGITHAPRGGGLCCRTPHTPPNDVSSRRSCGAS